MKVVSRQRLFFIRLFLALAALTGTELIISAVHDYPQTKNQLRLIRNGDNIAIDRPWIAVFYFLNEVGSGIKFALTRNERYMMHFPSPTHIMAHRIARAESGDWEAQIRLANLYHLGEWGIKDDAKALHWLVLARKNAPANKRTAITKIMQTLDVKADKAL